MRFRTAFGISAAAVVGAALWWRKNPSACPYGQRFWVEAVLLDVGDGHVELLAPLGPETPVGKYLERKGPGLHHVAYAVEDIDAELQRLAAAGIELIDSEARTGIRGSRVAFLHPRATGAVLTEIVEPAGGGH